MCSWLFGGLLIILTVYLGLFPASVQAIYDPLSVPNNKFGIHIISPSIDESSPAATLVNSSGGDWGYVTVLVERTQRDTQKWQQFFDDLRRRHLIPIVRIATEPSHDFWKRPDDKEEIAWADFLDNLNWPTKNRYVAIYNEPNQGKEWGNTVDPADYAYTLDKTIDAFKDKNPDFFILNAGFDASAPQKPPTFMGETTFLTKMHQAVPGIFNKLDGWVSHSYPNPGFVGSPDDSGQGTVRTYLWELDTLKSLGLTKNLPIFITETGWKHSTGDPTDRLLPSPVKVSEYFSKAFQNAWNYPNIVAVTPFLLNYQEEPFLNFSFKKMTGEKQTTKILGAQYPEYYDHYQTIAALPKTAGQPLQKNMAELTGGIVYPSVVAGQSYNIYLIFTNTGQSIWNDDNKVTLQFLDNQSALNPIIQEDSNRQIEPGQTKTFYIHFTAPKNGTHRMIVNLYNDNQEFESLAQSFTIKVKEAVSVQVKSHLKWKVDSSGQYLLTIASTIGNSIKQIVLNQSGQSEAREMKDLLPDQTYDFTLQKPFYKSKTIHQSLQSGTNLLDFGTLEPNISSALLNPRALWRLLPFSNNQI